MNNKVIVIILIVILSIIAIGLSVGFGFLMSKSNDFSFEMNFNSNLELVDSLEAEVETINNIDFNLGSADIEIKKSETNLIKVEMYSNQENNPKIEKNDSTIFIREQKENDMHIGIRNNQRKVILYVPDMYLGTYNIIVSSGDVVSEIDSSKNRTNIIATSGDINLNSIGEADIVTTSGDVKINAANQNVNIKVSSGDIDIGKILQRADIQATSGDVGIEELDIKENSKIEVHSGDVTIKNNKCNCYIEARATSGDTKVNTSDRKSDIEMIINTTSGDISVD